MNLNQIAYDQNNTWPCPQCTYLNRNELTQCELCQTSPLAFGVQDLSSSCDFGAQDTEFVMRGNSKDGRPPTSYEPHFTSHQHYGCTLQEDGSGSFLVWAPNAESVHVIGDFNGWNHDANPLEKSSNGMFSGTVAHVQHENHYKFLIRNGDKKLFRVDPRCLAMRTRGDSLDSIVWSPHFDWKSEDFVCPPLPSVVLYQLHIGAFGETQPGTANGTFLTCIPKLEHLVELGVNAVQLLPINQDFHETCWGYDPVSLFAIHREYGTPNDLKTFIDECHLRKLAVLVDWVPNHMSCSSVLHHWDTEDENTEGVYFYPNKEDRDTPFGPRLDYSQDGVREWLKDSIYVMLVDFRFDGVRVDSTITMRVTQDGRPLRDAWTLLQEVTALSRSWGANKICIAEDLQSNEDLHCVAGFDTQWDDATFYLLYGLGKPMKDEDRDMQKLIQVVERPAYAHCGHARVVFSESHDTVCSIREGRVPKWISDNISMYSIKRSTLLGAIILTIAGTPMLLQGQEFLETEQTEWPVPPRINWKGKEEYNGIFQMYRDLIALRRNTTGVTAGLLGSYVKVIHCNNNDKILVFHRFLCTGPKDDVVVVVNFSNKSFKNYRFGIPRHGTWYVRFNSDDKKYSSKFEGLISKTEYEASAVQHEGRFSSLDVEIARYSLIVLSQE